MSKKPGSPSPKTPANNDKGGLAASPDLFGPTVKPSDLDEMTKYGIKRIPVDYFHFGDFRYTNLSDAIAQAKKGCSTLSEV